MKFCFWFLCLLALFGSLSAADWGSSEEKAGETETENEVEEDLGEDADTEDEGFSVVHIERKNETLENPELEEMRQRLENLQNDALEALIYMKERMESLEEEVELNKDSLTSTDVVTSMLTRSLFQF